MTDTLNTFMSFDPGKNHVGWAYFDEKKMISCGLFYMEDFANAVEWLRISFPTQRVTIESQQVYAQRLQKGRQSDLIDVAHVAGMIAGYFAQVRGTKIDYVIPRTWKGTVPKKIMLARIQKAMKKNEQDHFDSRAVTRSLKHNILDAIGLGLWKCGRLN